MGISKLYRHLAKILAHKLKEPMHFLGDCISFTDTQLKGKASLIECLELIEARITLFLTMNLINKSLGLLLNVHVRIKASKAYV